MSRLRAMLVLMLLLSAATLFPAAAQDAGKDVPPDHWAYPAVQDLASRGLIKGYPPDNHFFGKRFLTRYEMATIMQRVVARMDDLLRAGRGASKEDLDKLQSSFVEIQALVNEFKMELIVIGTDMQKAKTDLVALESKVTDLDAQIKSFTDRIAAVEKKADDTSKAVDQAFENINELKTNTNAAIAKKVDVGVGKARVSGLFQIWYGNPFGDTLNGNLTNFGSAPSGRSFGGGVGDTFRLRRAEIALVGSIIPQVDYRVMIDPAKLVGVNTTTGTFSTPTGTATAVTGVTSNSASNILQDVWVGYDLVRSVPGRLRLEVGQQKTGLSEEGTRSSSQLLTVERAIMNNLPATIGRVGDIRDTGAVLKYRGALANASIGIWNDNGATQNGVDTDRRKFLMANAYYTGLRHLTLGLWGGTNVSDSGPRNVRDRAGATLIYQSGPHFFEAEGAYTLDYNGGAPLYARTIGLGGYALYAYRLSPQWQFVGRYDEWDPALHGGITTTGLAILPTDHNLKEYTIGVNYYFLQHNAKIQVNYIIDDTQGNGFSFFGIRRRLLLANFQTAF